MAESLSDSQLISLARDIAFSHHERWDGTGYPFKLQADSIPLAARIVSVADVYDALTTARTYKGAMPHGEALSIIVEGSGTQFDPEVVDALKACHEEFRRVAVQLRRSDLMFLASGTAVSLTLLHPLCCCGEMVFMNTTVIIFAAMWTNAQG